MNSLQPTGIVLAVLSGLLAASLGPGAHAPLQESELERTMIRRGNRDSHLRTGMR